MLELEKQYDPKSIEDKLYKQWEEKGYFKASSDTTKEPYTIVIPPPNVTGQLHMGHAFDNTLQDILIRTKRMQGYNALWIPGTDHAGIATQIKVEQELREKEQKTRYDLGRDVFLDRVWDWKNMYGDRIINQLKKMGASCDWSRERFTMDEGCSEAVKDVFVRLYEKGLIYKGKRIINWCPDCTTALSDAEVEYSEKDGNLWHIKYRIQDTDEFITIATTRPETLLGDTGIAVHPEDERYTHLIGKMAVLPLVDRLIPIFADEYVEKEFGTGCVKVTPYHDPNDFEMGLRHDLETILVLDDNGCVNENGGKYCGQDRYEARKNIVADLENLGQLVKIETHKHNVGTCYRCSTVIEPIASDQWFVKMEPLAKPALDVVKNGEIKFVPERFSKIYANWMENVHDWCISRQLWWGHRIPAYYCEDCSHMMVSKTEVCTCEKCSSKNIKQDEDVLDTWFSSALWPFSTLGFPEKTDDLAYFYPTSTLVTGYDIIFFWVARMIFMALENVGTAPFDTVFLHGIIRDSQGRKMSKSLGNGIDPLEIIEKYGADALRFTLATGNSPGNDMRFYNERVEANRNFTNKIWNASRFVQMNLTINEISLPKELKIEDKWILSKLNTLILEVTTNIDKYELGVSASKIYDFIWDDFCDWYIEVVKPRLQNKENTVDNNNVQNILCYVLANAMKLLHPFMPFITETIYQALPTTEESIMISKWCEYNENFEFATDKANMEQLMELIRAIRNRRAEMNVPPSKKAKVYVKTEQRELFSSEFVAKLSYASEFELCSDAPDGFASMVNIVTNIGDVFIPMSELINFEKEKERLQAELKKAEEEYNRVDKKLSNQGFVAKAPENVIKGEEEKREKYANLVEKLKASIASIGN
ncbi:MAG: valine--tRNA ligase [Clostridia bacterium]